MSDDHFVLDGDEILVEDPAPLGPYTTHDITADAAPDLDDDSGTGDGGTGAPLPTDGTDQPQAAAGSVFTLHSRPAATRKIFIDFDGQTVTNTAWNSGSTPITVGRYRTQPLATPDPGFSQSELDAINAIWEHVAEDFAPWDVDVTTEDPGISGLSKSSSSDTRYGIRVIVTPDYQWYSSQRYGGVAYLWSFARDYDLPAWVFSANLSNGDPKSVAEAVAHEAGHSLGLRHDGAHQSSAGGSTVTSPYYAGHGSWAPIMGVGYNKPVTQWSRGEYPGASNTEDDLALIDDMLPRLAPASATGSGPVLGQTDVTIRDVITTGGATSAHRLTVTAGPVAVNVRKADADGNLLASLTIRNSAGVAVATASPTNPSTWSLDATLPVGVAPGTYTIEVRSVGWLTPNDGFSSYASIGEYVMAVDVPGSSGSGGGQPTGPPQGPATPPSPTSTIGDRLSPISPKRVLDTRSPSSPITGRLSSGDNVRVRLAGIPSGTSAAVLNVVAVGPTENGYVSLTPCTTVAVEDRTSSVNFVPGENIANSVVVPVTSTGDVCIYASDATHLVVDVTGWIGSSGSLTLDEIRSFRAVDTRLAQGISTTLRAGSRTAISLTGLLDSGGVGAIALNVTAIRPENRGFLTIDDCSTTTPTTSTLNYAAGEIRGNNGIFTLGSGQRLCVYTTAATELTLDITGQFGTGDGLRFVAATPERVLDTRRSGMVRAGAVTSFSIPSPSLPNGFSRTAQAASINLTAARQATRGYVTAWDCGPRPETSALNPAAAQSTANGALVSLSPSGDGCLFHASGGHLIVDLAGWWI